MKCEIVERELLATRPEERSRLQNARLQRHLRTCASCAQALANWKEIDFSVSEWSSPQPSIDLKQRIAAALPEYATQHPPSTAVPQRQNHRGDAPLHRRWSGPILAMAVGVLLLLLFSLHDTPAAAMRRMQKAVSQVRTAHVTTWMLSYRTDNDAVLHKFDALQQVEEMWYQDGAWRKEGVWGSRIIQARTGTIPGENGRPVPVYGTYYRFDPQVGKVVAVNEIGAQWTRFTVEAITGLETAPDRYRITGKSTPSAPTGNHALQVERIGEENAFHYLCWIDPITCLPLRIDQQNHRSTGWITTVRYEFQFDTQIDPARFDPASLKNP